MRRLLPFTLLLGATSCSPPPPPVAVADPPAVPVPVVAEKPKDEPKPKPPEPAKAEPFRYAADAAGRKVEQVLAPTVPPEKEPRVTAPRPRVSEVDRGELPPKTPNVTAAPLPPTPRTSAVPPPPREGVPATVGVGSEVPLQDLKLPERP